MQETAIQTTTSTIPELRQQPIEMIEFSKLLQACDTLVKSRFLPEAIDTKEKAAAIILTGRELGIPTMQALRMINVIQGKPSMAAELILARAYQIVPGFNHEILERTDKKCVIRFNATGRKAYDHTFSWEDATKLRLTEKDNYKKQPATMLCWRCISTGLRIFDPRACNGVYTPEELNPDLIINENGEIIGGPVEKPKDAAAKTIEATATPVAAPVDDSRQKLEAARAAQESTPAVEPKNAASELFPEPTGNKLGDDQILKISAAFKKHGVTTEDLEKWRGLPISEWTDSVKKELLDLFSEFKCGNKTVEDFKVMIAD